MTKCDTAKPRVHKLVRSAYGHRGLCLAGNFSATDSRKKDGRDYVIQVLITAELKV